MSRVICPNCGRAYQAQGASPDCPRCHYRSGGPSYAPATSTQTRTAVVASTYSLPTDPAPFAPSPPRQQRSQATNGMAVASLVLGIIGLILWPVAFIALTLGIVGKVQTNKTGQPGGGLAVAGIVLGTLVIIIGIFIFMLVASLVF
ncbi:MAG TPA: DUF4190 domain-containing protein [Candidatus Thermoplasmatota archaeon]